ncbi:MAG: HAD family hydrolase [Rhodobacteraceae bacterium]|nr:HAD family hydrolase [Alphaproteobacteria bacterium]NNK66310.1 HAD family hydrolase [Paracoccaceae bacterium]
MRIAMWSGPRNLSTAMMYAFGQRGDCAVWDEPFYAAYLAATGLDHPMRDRIVAAGETRPDQVARLCTGSIPAGKAVFYQKLMTHHMLDEFPRDWLAEVRNVFLIRHPARVVASYVAKREAPEMDDLGFRQQVDLLKTVREMGQTPIVIDSADIRADPETALRGLCGALGLAFDPAMLSWPEGGHADDGVWAAHWYGAVHRSTGFAGSEGDLPVLEGRYARLAQEAMPFYETMRSAGQRPSI